MYYKEYLPNVKLRPFIRSYFHVRLDSDTTFRFPSDGCPGLIVNLGEPFLFGTDKNDLKVFTGSGLFGYLTRQLLVCSLYGAEALAVKFRMGRLTAFSKAPGIELTDTIVAIEDLWGVSGRDLVNMVYDTGSILETLQVLDEFLLKILSLHNPIERRIDSALNEILKRKGQVHIRNLAEWTNLSRRQFERRFSKIIGLPPKRMCRIVRLAGIIPQLKAGVTYDWADLALAAGFSDQSHFIREWKYFTGSSPLSYLNELSSFEAAIVGLL